MQPTRTGTVHIVDDDTGVREALAWLLRSRGLVSRSWESADVFLQSLEAGECGVPVAEPECLLLDVRMPGLSGLALFERLSSRGLTGALPVIFLTGHGDVPTAVDAVKRGAFDFCEKPFSDNALVDRVEQALVQSAQVLAERRERDAVRERLALLSAREQAVMQLVLEGELNKRIVDRLGISVRTVEVHRARVFDKMNVRSAVELLSLIQKAEQSNTI